MDYATINQARLAHVKLHGADATNEIIAKYAPTDEGRAAALGSVNEGDWPALLSELTVGASSSRKRPSSIEQLDTKAIWTRFNSGGRSRANQ